MKHGSRHVSAWLWWLVVVALALCVWLGIGTWTRRSAAPPIPPLPDLSRRSAAVADHLHRADSAARRDPRDQTVGALGMAYHADAFYDQAAACYRIASNLNPAFWKWTYLGSLIDEELGDTEATTEKLTRVLAVRPDLGVAWYRLGQAHYKRRRYEDAEGAFERAAAAPADAAESANARSLPAEAYSRREAIKDYAAFGLAQLAMARGDVDAARQILEEVAIRSPRFGAIHVMLGRVFRSLGREEGAREHERLAVDLPHYLPPSDPMLDELILESKSSDVLRKHAQMAHWNHNWRRGQFLLNRTLKLDPDDRATVAQMGTMLYEANRKPEALPYLRRAVQTQGEKLDVKAMVKLGDCLALHGQKGEAESFWGRAIARDAGVKDFHANLGTLLAGQGRRDEAIACYQRALAIDPELAEAHNNLGIALAAAGKTDDAIDHYRTALKLKKQYAEPHFNLGIVLQGRQDLEGAAEQYMHAVRIKPDYADAHNNLGSVHRAQGRTDEALAHYRRALELRPDSLEVANNLGAVLLAGGELDEAIEQFRRVLSSRPDLFQTHANLAMALAGRNDLRGAIVHYQKALALNPGLIDLRDKLATALFAAGDHAAALAQWRLVIEARPDDAQAHYKVGSILKRSAHVDDAISHLRRATQLSPDWPVPANDLAWLLATHADADVRKPNEAVQYAEQAARLTEHKNPAVLDTLAASYAAAGRFDDAVSWARKAITLAIEVGAAELAEQIRGRLEDNYLPGLRR